MSDPSRAPGRNRIPAIDVLRGAVMVLMVLDHARDFFFGFRVSPTDLQATTAPLFFTRWVTHFCAPTFVFLAGTSGCLLREKRGVPAASRFLLTRGAVLVLLEITVVRLCWIPDPFYRFTVLQVIWVIGWCMVLLSLAIRLPVPVIAILGSLIVGLHDFATPVHAKTLGAFSALWTLAFERGSLEPLPGHRIMVTYPIIPWFGVILLGYTFGEVMLGRQAERRAQARSIGLGAIGLFLGLRVLDLYGNPKGWSFEKSHLFTLMSFLNCEKYPPSLDFTLMTLGPALLLLSVLDREEVSSRMVPRALAVLGGVPLFFYVAHLALLRYTSIPFSIAKFGAAAIGPPPGHAGSPEWGLSGTYAAWVLAVTALYVPSRWFLRKKEANPDGVLKYF